MAIQLYDNFVIENKITDIVNTTLDVRSLMTIDNSLAVDAGLTKHIHKYTYTGTVEKLAKGAANTVKGAVALVDVPYTVERYQQTYSYNDMDVMSDPQIVDVMSNGAGVAMANEIKAEYFTELAKISKAATITGALTYDGIVDALQNVDVELDQSTLFIIMGADGKAAIRKETDFKASKQGEILYTGEFGTVSGVPCLFSKLVPAKTAYIANKDAIKFFVKKEGSVEQDRNIETKDNTVVYERHGLIALVDDTNCAKITFGA